MKFNKKIAIILLITLLSLVNVVGLLAPTNAAETWTDLTLPCTINESGNYRITAPYSGEGILVNINASNVVLDGQKMGLEQTGYGGEAAFYVNVNCTNVLVKNINQTFASYGLVTMSGNFTLQDSTFVNCTEDAFIPFNATGITVKRCLFANSSYGFESVFSNDISITDTIITNTTLSSQLVLCNNISLQNCTFTYGDYGGFNVRDSNDIIVTNSTFSSMDNYAFNSLNGSFTLSNCLLDDSMQAVIYRFSNATVSNCTFSNNFMGILSSSSNSTLQNLNIIGNYFYGIVAEESNNTQIKNCNIQNSGYNGITLEACNSTRISDTIIKNSETGILAVNYDYTCISELILENSLIQNCSYYGLGNEWLANLVVTNNTFSNNGFYWEYDFDSPVNGALVTIDSNCTATGNTFFNNSYAFLSAAIENDTATNQVYTKNNFQNNTYTMLIGYVGNSTNHNFRFYNNLVNDSSYIDPMTFTGFFDYYNEITQQAPPSTAFSLNATMQVGTRIYGAGSMIGGNYWAHPNGTGPSQTGKDINRDGFIDSPVELFGNATYGTAYDYLPLSTNYTSILAFTAGSGQTIGPNQMSEVISVKRMDYFGAVAGITVNLMSSSIAGNFYSDAAGTKQITNITLTSNQTSASFYYRDSIRGTPVITVQSQYANQTQTTFTIDYSSSSSSGSTTTTTTTTPTVTPTPTPTVTPTPTPETIQATKGDNSKATITINGGNIAASQYSNATITTNQTDSTTVLSFTITGETGTEGFCNLTIAKSEIPYGTTPVVYIDGSPAENQGYTEDANNYYIWYTTHFSTHQISVQFSGVKNATSETPILTYAVVAVVVIAVLVVAAFVVTKRKHK